MEVNRYWLRTSAQLRVRGAGAAGYIPNPTWFSVVVCFHAITGSDSCGAREKINCDVCRLVITIISSKIIKVGGIGGIAGKIAFFRNCSVVKVGFDVGVATFLALA